MHSYARRGVDVGARSLGATRGQKKKRVSLHVAKKLFVRGFQGGKGERLRVCTDFSGVKNGLKRQDVQLLKDAHTSLPFIAPCRFHCLCLLHRLHNAFWIHTFTELKPYT